MAVVTKTIGSGKDHATVAAWEAAVGNFGTDIYKGVISTNDNFDENVTLAGGTGTPSITSYLWLTVDAANRHSGVAGTGHGRMYGTGSTHIITVDAAFTRIEWLDIKQDQAGASDEGIRVKVGSDDILVSYCIIWTDSGAASQDGIYGAGNYDIANLRLDNCIIYGWDRTGIHLQQFAADARTITGDIDHCAFFNNGLASIRIESDGASDSITLGVFNTWGSTTDEFSPFSDGDALTATTTPDGTVIWNGSDNGVSNPADLDEIDGTNNLTATELATDGIVAVTKSSGAWIVVNNITAGSVDLLLLDDAAGNIMAGRGIDRSEPDARQDFSTDITGGSRPTSGVDIGAHQVSAAGPVSTPFDLIAKKTGTAPDPPLRIPVSRLIQSEVVVLPPVKLLPLHTGTEVEVPRPPQTTLIRPEVIPALTALPPDHLVHHTGTDLEIPRPPETVITRPEVIPPLTALLPSQLLNRTGTDPELVPPPVTILVRPDVVIVAPVEELPAVHHTGTAIEVPPPPVTTFIRPDVIPPLTALPPEHLVLRTGTDLELPLPPVSVFTRPDFIPLPVITLPGLLLTGTALVLAPLPITRFVATVFLPIVVQPGSETGRSSGTLAADRGIDLGTQTTGQSPVSAKTGKSPSSL